MNRFNRLFTDVLRDEWGQDLVEYALVAALIALGVAAATNGLATAIVSTFTGIGSKLTTHV